MVCQSGNQKLDIIDWYIVSGCVRSPRTEQFSVRRIYKLLLTDAAGKGVTKKQASVTGQQGRLNGVYRICFFIMSGHARKNWTGFYYHVSILDIKCWIFILWRMLQNWICTLIFYLFQWSMPKIELLGLWKNSFVLPASPFQNQYVAHASALMESAEPHLFFQ